MIPFVLAARWQANNSSKAGVGRAVPEEQAVNTDIECASDTLAPKNESVPQLETVGEPTVPSEDPCTASSRPPVGPPHLGLTLPLEELASPVPPHVPTGAPPPCPGLW